MLFVQLSRARVLDNREPTGLHAVFPGVAGIDPDYVRERRSTTGFAVEIAVPAMPFPDSEGTKSAGEIPSSGVSRVLTEVKTGDSHESDIALPRSSRPDVRRIRQPDGCRPASDEGARRGESVFHHAGRWCNRRQDLHREIRPERHGRGAGRRRHAGYRPPSPVGGPEGAAGDEPAAADDRQHPPLRQGPDRNRDHPAAGQAHPATAGGRQNHVPLEPTVESEKITVTVK